MDFAKRKKFNLKVLQRHDPMICEILDQSPHGVMYKFAVERISWVCRLETTLIFLRWRLDTRDSGKNGL